MPSRAMISASSTPRAIKRRAAAEAADVEMAHAMVHLDDFGERRKRLLAAIAGGVDRQKAVDAEHGHRALSQA